MNTLETLFARKSVRSYTGEMPTNEELELILKAANASPVGLKQYDTLHLTVIKSAELLAEIEHAAGAMFGKADEDFHPLYGAPVLVVVSLKKPAPGMEATAISNAAIVAHNMAIAATALNLGVCHIWGATAGLARNEELVKKLNLPADFAPCCAVCVGKTEEVYTEREIPTDRIAHTVIE